MNPFPSFTWGVRVSEKKSLIFFFFDFTFASKECFSGLEVIVCHKYKAWLIDYIKCSRA